MPHILVIDEDPIAQETLKRTLQDQGYQVTVALNGKEGLAQAQQLCPDLMICAWQMAEMDGLEVCRQSKADPALSTTFFILLTPRSEEGDRLQELATEVDDFLFQPIEVRELKARVRAGLRVHQSAQDLRQLTEDLQTQQRQQEIELKDAADYVRSLLPEPLTGVVTTEAQFLPSRQLGGDCFDYYWLDPDYLAIYLLDVSGHGLGAAIPSLSVLNLLRFQSMDSVNLYQPHLVLQALNETFHMDQHNGRYFTIWYGVYNRQNRKLNYSSAGHPPAILISGVAGASQVKHLKTRSIPIGLWPDRKFISATCIVEPSSTLYLFSDGLYDFSEPNEASWGLASFIQLLQNYYDQGDRHLDQVLEWARAFHPTGVFEDDCSLLQLKFR